MDRKRGRDPDGAMYGGSGPAKRPYQGLTTNDALSYLRDVKTRFANDKHIYDEFLEIMKEFKASRVDTAGVIVRVKELFAGHRELILGFNTFLPKGYEIEMPLEDEQKPKQPVEFDQAINYVNKIKTRFSNDERVYKAFLEILNMYRKGQKTITNVYEEVAMLFKSHSDLLEEFTYFLPDSTPPSQQAKRPMGRGKPFGRGAAAATSNYPKRKSRRGEDPDYAEEDGGFARTNLAKELHFFEKVKAKLRSREAYQDFLKCLNLYAQEVISKSELTHLVHDLIGRFSDLALGFNEFLTRCEVLDFDLDGKMASQGKMTIRDITRMKQLSQAEKLATRPVSELDVTNWKRCTTSYVQLPHNYPTMVCSGRRHNPPLFATLLNDEWVSVTSGSEDYSFKHMRKNQYEEALFRVEDDRFELDMMIETNASALRAMAALARQLEHLDPEQRARWAPPSPGETGALNAIHYRAVQRIYGESGYQMVDLLKKNPAVAIPVCLARLVQKDSEWRESKKNMAPLWQKVYDANYHKSLDHRSFYFKQTDKRLLGAKGMVSDIREIVEKRRQADGGLAAVSAAADFSARLHADITYDYSARNVHEDVFIILRDALKEMMTPELAAKSLELFNGLVEDFFGMPARAPEEPSPEPSSEEAAAARAAPSGVKSPAKHKRLAMLTAEKDGADTDTDTGAPDDERGGTPAAEAPKTAADMLMDAAAEADTDAVPSPAARAGDANSGVSSDASPSAEKADADRPRAMDVERGASAASGREDDAHSDHSSEDESEAAQARYAHCKPLAPVMPPLVPASPPQSDGEEAGDAAAAAEAPSRVFYGNEQYYVFFRLHQYLYDRLRVAHTCSHKKHGYLGGGSGAHAEGEGKSPEEYRATHAKFMSLVHDLIVGTLDASQYEDACRALLGTGSYVLFTLEKLIYKVVKQLQTLVQDDLAFSLYQLYRYENARGEAPKDATYFANAHVLLHDDVCFRFASLPRDRASLQMMDPDKSEVPAGMLEPSFAAYLRSFTESSAPQPDPAAKIFLLRNFPGGRAVDLAAPPLEGMELTNGLECKIATATSKVSYVLDTEDVFRRHKRKQGQQAPSPDAAARKARKFRSWQEAAGAQQQQQSWPSAVTA